MSLMRYGQNIEDNPWLDPVEGDNPYLDPVDDRYNPYLGYNSANAGHIRATRGDVGGSSVAYGRSGYGPSGIPSMGPATSGTYQNMADMWSNTPGLVKSGVGLLAGVPFFKWLSDAAMGQYYRRHPSGTENNRVHMDPQSEYFLQPGGGGEQGQKTGQGIMDPNSPDFVEPLEDRLKREQKAATQAAMNRSILQEALYQMGHQNTAREMGINIK